ncbi:origin recognition complex subunit 5 C-terminus-domain-containing protein [Lineolata rhizophorae]|uniref:Origin recognition complex subunit 5 C-terminus-domain-containing protein n=1 Tax=Lineolata rhizophorae TaxID=578093 RepID=A0A6A6NS55_9PEZI|nr:origin recognition complex subunit 5 C-terminus-domain-containing protein [Lineolata rhizophorae]
MLPEELFETLNEQFRCRESQIRQLSALYSPWFPSPPTAVIHGLPSTGKSSIISAVLDVNDIPHALVDSAQCVTGRHLLERITGACVAAIEAAKLGSDDEDAVEVDRQMVERTENISALAVNLTMLMDGYGEQKGASRKFVLVVDGVDKQREAPPTLIAGLARLGEMIPGFHTLLILHRPLPHLLHISAVPHIHFPPYTRAQCIHILSRYPRAIFPELPEDDEDYTAEEAAQDNEWLWPRYLGLIWDALARGAARDLSEFEAVAERLWARFVQPIVDGELGTRDFSRLVIRARPLMQGEVGLSDGWVSAGAGSGTTSKSTAAQITGKGVEDANSPHDLPYFTKVLLCAAYLASYNPARQDPIYFMKTADKKKRQRKASATTLAKASKHKKIPRQLLPPSPFQLDRLLAILRALLPHSVPQTADLLTTLATLVSLRLLLRSGAAASTSASASAGTTAAGDVLDGAGKWRVNFGWEYANALGRSVGLELAEWLAGGE